MRCRSPSGNWVARRRDPSAVEASTRHPGRRAVSRMATPSDVEMTGSTRRATAYGRRKRRRKQGKEYDVLDEELRIIGVELPEESLESYRVQHKDGSGRYSVVLRLSRAADEYERLYIGGERLEPGRGPGDDRHSQSDSRRSEGPDVQVRGQCAISGQAGTDRTPERRVCGQHVAGVGEADDRRSERLSAIRTAGAVGAS
jgi:hypothetical protein